MDNQAKGQCIFQYNYTHDNEGGFMEESVTYPLGATGSDSAYAGTIWRYNVSLNDGDNSHDQDSGLYDGKIANGRNGSCFYNNVFYNDTMPFMFFANCGSQYTDPITKTIIRDTFVNNIFWGKGWTYYWNNNIFKHNCYWGGCESAVADSIDSNAVKANPRFIITDTNFRHGGGRGAGFASAQYYKLQDISQCIDSGLRILNNGGFDFWGDTLYKKLKPNNDTADIGAYEKTAPAATDTLIVTHNSGGITFPDTLDTIPPVPVRLGEVVPISAVPNTGHTFSYWQVTSGTATIAYSDSASTTVTITSGSKATVTATFSQ